MGVATVWVNMRVPISMIGEACAGQCKFLSRLSDARVCALFDRVIYPSEDGYQRCQECIDLVNKEDEEQRNA
jgi:hypothetical protein